ncbi:platelet-activating factor acetylhydrolase, isoform II-domain-containing protein [Xylariales sp. AK1849]|nr:platelet-activating factor acetylhydrolase, isoform II-domain-containing protein [Xylariales sp. AK1849]
MFTLFYPAEKGAKGAQQKHQWIPESNKLYAEGYARFAHISNFFTNTIFEAGLWALVGSTTIPAEVDVPLHGIEERYATGDKDQQILERDGSSYKFPVVVFSHGMASGRTSYTHYLASLASRGYVVAAVEHRDGSGPGSIVMRADGTTKTVFHTPGGALDPVPEVEELKRVQLALRQAEVEETVRVLRLINESKGHSVFQSNPRGEGTTFSTEDWYNRLDLDQVVMAGHSYGATLAMQALKDAPNEARPFKAGIALDPGKSSGRLNDNISVPLLVIHSQSWSSKHSIFFGRPHFDTVKEIVQNVIEKSKKSAWFMTAKGTTHPTVTDAPLIEPFLLSWTTGATVDVKEGLMQYVNVSSDFLRYLDDGRIRGVLKEPVSHPEYNKEERPLPRGMAKFWQLHVSPEGEAVVS